MQENPPPTTLPEKSILHPGNFLGGFFSLIVFISSFIPYTHLFSLIVIYPPPPLTIVFCIIYIPVLLSKSGIKVKERNSLFWKV